MTFSRLRAMLLATMLCAAAATAAALAAPSPAPKSSAAPITLPSPHMPTVALHTEYNVEVNKKGQVVKVTGGKNSTVPMFNTWTFGNAQQMWIRHPDGSAVVGLFKVTYDYDPSTKKVARGVSLISTGGTWGDEEGYANQMIDLAKKEYEQQQKDHAQQSKSLPSLHELRGESPSPSPSPAPASSAFILATPQP